MNTHALQNNARNTSFFAQKEIDRIIKECGRVFVHAEEETHAENAQLYDAELTAVGVLVANNADDMVRIMERQRVTLPPLVTRDDIVNLLERANQLVEEVGKYAVRAVVALASLVEHVTTQYETWLAKQRHTHVVLSRVEGAEEATPNAVKTYHTPFGTQRARVVHVAPPVSLAPYVHEHMLPNTVPVETHTVPVAQKQKNSPSVMLVLRILMRDLFDFTAPIDKRR